MNNNNNYGGSSNYNSNYGGNSNYNNGGGKNKRKRLIIILSVVVAIIAIASIVCGIMIFSNKDKEETTSQNQGNADTKVHETVSVDVYEDVEEIEEEDYLEDIANERINVLVLGMDKPGLRSDTIMLISYDMEAQEVNLMSIPRDTVMYVGSSYQKINAAYSTRNSKGEMIGVHGVIEAVTRLTGIPIHYYVEFDFDAFRETIDILGGVEFDVPQRMKYSDPYQDMYIDLQSGLQILDGDKAEQLVCFRSYPRGDIQRIETQQAFLKAIIEQKLNADVIDKIPEMFDELADDIKTNFTPMEVAKYGMSLMSLPPENINMYTLPGRFSEYGEYDFSCWVADTDEIRELAEYAFVT